MFKCVNEADMTEQQINVQKKARIDRYTDIKINIKGFL